MYLLASFKNQWSYEPDTILRCILRMILGPLSAFRSQFAALQPAWWNSIVQCTVVIKEIHTCSSSFCSRSCLKFRDKIDRSVKDSFWIQPVKILADHSSLPSLVTKLVWLTTSRSPSDNIHEVSLLFTRAGNQLEETVRSITVSPVGDFGSVTDSVFITSTAADD